MSVAPVPPAPARPGRRSVLASAKDSVPFERSVRVMLAMGGPMVLAVMFGRPDLGALACIGALFAPTIGGWTYPQRAQRLPVVALLMGAAYWAGAAVGGGTTWAAVAVVGLWAALSSLGAGLLGDWAGPFATISAAACIIGTGFGPGGWPLWAAAAVVTCGGLWVTLIFCLGWAPHRWQPQTRAVADVLRAIADYLASIDTPDADACRIAARRSLLTAWDALGMREPQPDAPNPRRILCALLIRAQRLLDASVSMGFSSRQQVPADLSDAVRALSLTIDDPKLAAFLRIPTPPVDADRRLLRCYALAEDFRAVAAGGSAGADGSMAPLRETVSDRLHGMGPVQAVHARAAVRLGLAVAVAQLVAVLAPLAHGYWVAVTALLVMRSDAAATHVRAAQRALGTVVGVALAGGLLLVQSTEQVTAIGMCVVAYLVPAALARSYLWGSAARTGFALLLIESAHPGAFGPTVMAERVADTLIGAVIAVCAVLLLWPFAATHRLPAAVAVCLRSIAGLLRDGAAGQTQAHGRRRDVILHLLSLRSLYEQAVGERSRRWPRVEAFWPVVVFTLRLGAPARFAAGAAGPADTRPLLTLAGAAEVAGALTDIADAVAAGQRPGPLPWPAARTESGLHEAVCELHAAAVAAAR